MESVTDDPIGTRLQWAVRIAREAGQLTLRHFRNADLHVDRKADDSPVTAADREAEELLRRLIGERFPDDSILGEELGSTDGSTGYQWVLDPIDGTKSFIHGVPLYTTLVAVLEGDQPCLGVIHAPAAAETVYAATGSGCWYLAGEGVEPLRARVSRVSTLRESLLLTGEFKSFATERPVDALDVYLRLHRAARLARTWGDGYGYLMVATGRAEVMIDPVMNLWDIAALAPVIEEAGGDFRDWQGRPTIHASDCFATNGLVTDEVLAITKR
jgi:histidinol phosphatase-like enzyme (inositol monophosphatase family)